MGDIDLHLRTLRDNQQFSDDQHEAEGLGITSAQWPLFGVIWASGEILAHLMYDYDIHGKRILEIGCGIAMSSLVLHHREADITATDYHPEAETFLKANIALNSGSHIPFFLLDWAGESSALGRFDLIIGSDLLYERGHPALLSNFIEMHANPECEVIIVDPGRSHQNKFTREMERLLFAHSATKPEPAKFLNQPFKGLIHRYLR